MINPSLKESIKSLERALKKKHAVMFSCDCEISYSGRAESKLMRGDRIVLIKPDQTIIIHRHTGSQPVNWMPANAVHLINLNNDVLELKSLRDKEELLLKIFNIHFLHSQILNDAESIQLVGSEKDMARMILKKPFLISSKFKPLSEEEHTKYGFIDVFGYEGKDLVVIECKRYGADLGAVSQLRRYVEKIKSSKGLKNVKGIIAAPKISKNALNMLTDWGFSFKQISPPKQFTKANKYQKKLMDY